MKKIIEGNSTKKVLKPEQKTVEVVNTPAKQKKKRYHKKPKQAIADIQSDVENLVEDTKTETKKLNPITWFKKQWSKFVLWYKS